MSHHGVCCGAVLEEESSQRYASPIDLNQTRVMFIEEEFKGTLNLMWITRASSGLSCGVPLRGRYR